MATRAQISDGDVVVTSPTVLKESLLRLTTEWVSSQSDRYWPGEITGQVVAKNLELYYVPHYILQGSGNGLWSANIGEDYEVRNTCTQCHGKGVTMGGGLLGKEEPMTCPWCNGKGYQPETRTRWTSQGGMASGKIDEINSNSQIGLRCGSRQKNAAKLPVPSSQLSNYLIADAKATSKRALIEIAQDKLQRSIESDASDKARRLGKVRDLTVSSISYTHIDAQHWLYPIYFGQYHYGSEALAVQIDGVTGKVWADIPQSVKDLRFKRNLKIGLLIAVIIAVIVGGIYFYTNQPYDFSGVWKGQISFEGFLLPTIYRYEVDISQDGSNVQGTINISRNPFEANLSFVGVADKENLVVNELRMIDSDLPASHNSALERYLNTCRRYSIRFRHRSDNSYITIPTFFYDSNSGCTSSLKAEPGQKAVLRVTPVFVTAEPGQQSEIRIIPTSVNE